MPAAAALISTLLLVAAPASETRPVRGSACGSGPALREILLKRWQETAPALS